MAPKSLLITGALLLAGLASPLSSSLVDTAAATGASTVGHELRDLGNPCNAVGFMGGVASNPAAKQVFYSSENRSTIFRITYNVGFTTITCTSFTWAAGATNGWSSLVWDGPHNVLWGWRNGTNQVYRIALPACASPGTCAVTPTAWTTTGAATRGGLTVIGNDLYVAPAGGSTVVKHVNGALTANVLGSAPMAFGSLAPGGGARGLANFGGALFALDAGHNVFTYAPTGLGHLGRFWLHDEIHDSFHQVYDQGLFYTTPDLAFDATTFGPKGAVWILQESYTYSVVCIANCQVPPCLQTAVNEAGQVYCVLYGADPDGPNQYATSITHFPTVEARESPRAPCTGPDFTCACPPPAPAFTASQPANRVHLRGQVVSPTPTPMPVFFRGPATFVLTVANVQDPLVWIARDGVDLYGPGPSTTHTLTFPAGDPLWSARGQHTLQARVLDRATGCFATGPLLRFWVDDPTLWTHAQALRVEGNLPANLVLGTPPMAPADDLVGEERSLVVDRHAAAPLRVDAEALCAEARHGLLSSPLQFTAEAHACSERLDVDLDLAALCDVATGNDPSCALLPSVVEVVDGFHSRVRVEVAPLATAWSSSEAFSLHDDPAAAVPCSTFASVPGYAVANGGCLVQLPGVTLAFYQSTLRQGPLFVERTFVPLRVAVQQGPFQGEVVVGEVHAGISLGGRALLTGPPGRMPGTGDYGLAADAPSAVGSAPVLSPGAYSGSFAGSDTVDAFRVNVDVHQKVRVQLATGHRVQATLMPAPDLPALLVGVREYRVTLYDPLGNVRDVDAAEEGSLGPSVELNADVGGPGAWGVRLERLDDKVLPSTYGVVLSVTDAPLLPNDDAGSGDAPAVCATPKTLAPGGVFAGSLPSTDAADVFALPVLARPGPVAAQKFVVALTPLDPDGADLDLVVTDAACTFVAAGAPSDDPLVPKGHVEVALHTGAAGDYRVHVVRANGVGSYTLQVLLAP